MARWEVWSLKWTDKVPSYEDLDSINILLRIIDYDHVNLDSKGWASCNVRSPFNDIDAIANFLDLLGFPNKFDSAYEGTLYVEPKTPSRPELSRKFKEYLEEAFRYETDSTDPIKEEFKNHVFMIVTMSE